MSKLMILQQKKARSSERHASSTLPLCDAVRMNQHDRIRSCHQDRRVPERDAYLRPWLSATPCEWFKLELLSCTPKINRLHRERPFEYLASLRCHANGSSRRSKVAQPRATSSRGRLASSTLPLCGIMRTNQHDRNNVLRLRFNDIQRERDAY